MTTKALVLIYQWVVAVGLTSIIGFRTSTSGILALVLIIVTVAATDVTLAVAKRSMRADVKTRLDLFAVWLIGFIAGGSLLICYYRLSAALPWTNGLFIVLVSPAMALVAHGVWDRLKRRLGVTSYGQLLGLPSGLMDYVQSYGVSLTLCILAAWVWYVVL